jgi:hypothetical protein
LGIVTYILPLSVRVRVALKPVTTTHRLYPRL